MDRRTFLASTLVLAASAAVSGPLFAAQAGGEAKMVLPPAQTGGGKPLMETLMLRRSVRAFSPRPLEPQVLSNLLWAAWGISRNDGRRTAPSARNAQETTVYAAMADGLFVYDAKEHALVRVLNKDLRALTGRQDFVATAPLNLIYVADLGKISDPDMADKLLYAGCDVGAIFQNVYLSCASQGLATVVRAYIDKPALAKEMNLGKNHIITLAQTVGYPKG